MATNTMQHTFDWKKQLHLLSETHHLVGRENILLFARSSLPNAFFVRQFTHIGLQPFCQKKYWRAFALVLISRGINNVADVYNEMLMWLQDINWPGSVEMASFVADNFTQFREIIKDSLLQAINTSDEAWANALLTIIYRSNGLSDSEINCKLQAMAQFWSSEADKSILYSIVEQLSK